MAKAKKVTEECLGSCLECANANYICEGDFLCDAYNNYSQSVVVVSDWEPTKNYYKCGGKYYKPV